MPATATLGTVLFANSPTVTFGIVGNTITASAAGGGGGLTNIGFSAGTLSQLRSDITFGNANGISFGLETNGIITASHNALTSQSVQPVAISGSNGSFAFSTVTFGNLNGISFYTSNGSMVASHNALTSQSNQALSGSNGSFTFQTATFGNLNGLSFYTSNGSLVGSYTVPSVPAQSNQTLGIYAVGNTLGASSSSTYDARSLSIDFQGIISGGWTNGSLQLSVPSGGGGLTNINVSAGTTSQNLSNIVFSNSNGVSFGLNGSTITASVAAGGGGGTVSNNFPPFCFGNSVSFGQVGNATVAVQPMFVPCDAHFDRVMLGISFSLSSSSNSSHAGNLTFRVGIYTKNGSTLSLASSGSQTYQWTNTSNNSSSVLVGPRVLSVPLLATLTPGNYWIAVWSRSSTTNANWFTASNMAVTSFSNVWSHSFLAATNTSQALVPGMGRFTVSSTALPVSMAFSNITHAALRTVIPWCYLTSGTY